MKTIIEMAGKAFETQGVEPAFRNGFWTVTSEELERFAELVRADEREACLHAMLKSTEKAVDASITIEREACAKLCDIEEETANQETWYQCAKELAKQIRARTNT